MGNFFSDMLKTDAKMLGMGGDEPTKLTDQRTPEQLQMAQILQQLAATGSGGGINLGDAYTGSLGNYDVTDTEKQSLAQLQSLFNGSDIAKARQTYTNLADTTFDPSNPTSGYAAFDRALAKSGKQSEDVINRDAAVTGNRFGDRILNTKQSLANDLMNTREQKLAELFQQSRSSQLAGAQGLQGLVGTQATLANQAATYGATQRDLLNQQATAQYNEFQRQRGETLGRLDLLNQEAGRNPNLGISEILGQSPFSVLANSVLGAAGTAIGGPVGGMIASGIGNLFSSNTASNYSGLKFGSSSGSFSQAPLI
jgi:hypothetical protein